MDTVIGILGWIVIGVVVWAIWSGKKSSARNRPAVPPNARSAALPGRSVRREPPELPDHSAGWLIGHGIASGQTGVFGDPLPGGHLGTPENLAFWGSIVESEDDED